MNASISFFTIGTSWVITHPGISIYGVAKQKASEDIGHDDGNSPVVKAFTRENLIAWQGPVSFQQALHVILP